MGQKANTKTLKLLFYNLNLQTRNSKIFWQGYFFTEILKKMLARKSIILSNYTVNFIGNICFLNLAIFFKTTKMFFLKKHFFKTLKLGEQKKNLHLYFSKIIYNALNLSKTNLFVFAIKVLNKDFKLNANKHLLSFFFIKSKPFLNILFQRRFTFFFDFIKQIVLLLKDLMSASTFLQNISLLFKYLHKRMHTRFFIFFNLISHLIINCKQYIKIKLSSEIKGLKLLVKGKLKGKMRASLKYLQEGTLPTQSINKKIEIGKQSVCTLYGVFGLTLWVHRT